MRLWLQINFQPWQRDNDLTPRQRFRGGDSQPFDCRNVAVDEHELFWGDLPDVVEDRFARSVGAKLELVHPATERLRRLLFVERYEFVRGCIPQNSCRRFWICVANKED